MGLLFFQTWYTFNCSWEPPSLIGETGRLSHSFRRQRKEIRSPLTITLSLETPGCLRPFFRGVVLYEDQITAEPRRCYGDHGRAAHDSTFKGRV